MSRVRREKQAPDRGTFDELHNVLPKMLYDLCRDCIEVHHKTELLRVMADFQRQRYQNLISVQCVYFSGCPATINLLISASNFSLS